MILAVPALPESDLRKRIERYLLAHGGWVSAKDICARFGVEERSLRGFDGESGLLSEFAISGQAGYRHVERATTEEWKRFKHRIRRHAINEFRRVRTLDRRRTGPLMTFPPFPRAIHHDEKVQGVLFSLN